MPWGGAFTPVVLILVDTSVWVEYLRATGSAVDGRLTGLLGEEAELATTDAVLMEVLAGARDDAHFADLRGLLGRCEFLSTRGPTDYEDAAEIYRACRRRGATIRKLVDCLVAAVALREGAEVLHTDDDLRKIAEHFPLKQAR